MALGGIFSITVFIMLFAIVRVVVVSSYSHQPDQTWLYMWSNIEQAVCELLASSISSLHDLKQRPEADFVRDDSYHGCLYRFLPLIVQKV